MKNELTGRVLKGIGGFYYVRTEDGSVYTVRAQGKFRHERMKPLVGDIVTIVPGNGEEDGWISAISPRKNCLRRPNIANIDTLLIVATPADPEPDLLMADKLVMDAVKSGIDIVFTVNKCDLAPERAESIARQYAAAALGIHTVSARTGRGIDKLREALTGRFVAVAGQSGVGKSSLINALYGLSLETGELSSKIERGKNTTRKCELLPLENGGAILDTPGFSLLENELMPPEDIRTCYPEFILYNDKCYFPNCLHITEPGCCVTEKVEEGTIDRARYERYVILTKEQKTIWKNRYNQ